MKTTSKTGIVNMADPKQVIQHIFAGHNISIPPAGAALLDKFLSDDQNIHAINAIIENQTLLINKWQMENTISEIINQPLRILNGTVGKSYEARFDPDTYNWKDISEFQFKGLEEIGLQYDKQLKQIMGIPSQSGDFKIKFEFKLKNESKESPFHEKSIPLIINPDPKSLWKNIEGDRNDPYWKENDVTVFEPIGDRHILVSSKRGRAHANKGLFREDDFAFSEFDSGWSLVTIADGAGSAKFSRKGSAIACNAVIEYFREKFSTGNFAAFDELINQYRNNPGDETQKRMRLYVYNELGKAAVYVHKKLVEFANKAAIPLPDLNATHIFTMFKKYDIGYAFLSFGVGDCPIAIINKDVTEVILMNWIDVGEYGGGTRFITMPEIFQSDKFASRFGFKLIDDFSYLIMMSDGIYDPKFVVEANLPKIEKWKEFLADLGGKNEDKIKVELIPGNGKVTEQFSTWMDFWSQGNHDDRTLAIVF